MTCLTCGAERHGIKADHPFTETPVAAVDADPYTEAYDRLQERVNQPPGPICMVCGAHGKFLVTLKTTSAGGWPVHVYVWACTDEHVRQILTGHTV